MTMVPPSREVALAAAHQLVRMGNPVFVCGLRDGSDPVLPKAWQKTRPDHAEVDKWQPGMGLCMVTGIKLDVIDIDPRNGGLSSFEELSERLGEDGPHVYWEVSTPSGGTHLYIAPLGIGSHNGIMPGIDLKGGKPDGSGRGFVFIPPTARRSKVASDD